MNHGFKLKWPFEGIFASVVVISVFLIGGIGVYLAFRSPPPNPLPLDDRNAKAELLKWIPIGTSLEDAEANLKNRKFVCDVVREKDGTDILVASIVGPGSITYGLWDAAFKIERGKVIELSVHVTIRGL